MIAVSYEGRTLTSVDRRTAGLAPGSVGRMAHARHMRSFAASSILASLTCMCVLFLPADLRAQAGGDWVGKRVVQKAKKLELKQPELPALPALPDGSRPADPPPPPPFIREMHEADTKPSKAADSPLTLAHAQGSPVASKRPDAPAPPFDRDNQDEPRGPRKRRTPRGSTTSSEKTAPSSSSAAKTTARWAGPSPTR